VPYRIAAPPPPDPLESEEPYAAVLRAGARRMRWTMAIVAVLAIAGVCAARSVRQRLLPRAASSAEGRTDARVARAREAVGRARAKARLAHHAFDTRVREAIGEGRQARAELGPCPVALPSPPDPAPGGRPPGYGAEGSTLTRSESNRRGFPLLVIERAALGTLLPSQSVTDVLTDVQRAEAHLHAGRYDDATLYAKALERSALLAYEVVLLVDSQTTPRAASMHEYVPGALEGRAYLYDFRTESVLCGGNVTVKSSPAVGYTHEIRRDTAAWFGAIGRMDDVLQEDFRLQTEREVARAVRWRLEGATGPTGATGSSPGQFSRHSGL